MFQLVREYWYAAVLALVAVRAAVAGSGVVAVVFTAIRCREYVPPALRRLGRMFTD